MALLDEYRVGVDGPFGTAEAAHLWRRAGFGATPEEQVLIAGDGTQTALRAAVDELVLFTPEDPYLDQPAGSTPGGYGAPLADLPDDTSDLGKVKNPRDLLHLIGHWLYRMRYTSQPLQEKLALLYHDHFCSEWFKVVPLIQFLNVDDEPARDLGAAMLLDQNYLFRRTGADSFRDLLINITRDPCMLMYLDNVANRKGLAQENYARELMELFSMGVGNYSEDDVREIAKCLTGETLPRFKPELGLDPAWEFDDSIHEPGDKQLFGETIPEDFAGQETLDVIDLVLAERSRTPDVSGLAAPYNTLPATAVYMSWKLLTWFVHPDISLNPPAPAVLELAHYMRGTDNGAYPNRRFPYDFRAVLRKLFLSQYFFSQQNRLTHYTNPAEFVTGFLRQGGFADLFATEFGPGTQMTLMGMILFNPPDVSGWKHGRSWITSGSLVARYNYVQYLMDYIFQGPEAESRIDQLLGITGGPIPTPDSNEALLDYWAERLLPAPLSAEERATLLEFLDSITTSTPSVRFRQRVRGLIHVMMSMPLAQLK